MTIYGQSITYFSRWLETHGRAATLEEFARAAIREWLATLADTRETSTARARYRGSFGSVAGSSTRGSSPRTR